MPESSAYQVTSALTLLESSYIQLKFFVVTTKQVPDHCYYVFAVQCGVTAVLHWGVAIDNPKQWLAPTRDVLPPFQASVLGASFAETHFVSSTDLLKKADLASWLEAFCDAESIRMDKWRFVVGKLPAMRSRVGSISALNFVIHCLEDNRWVKDPSGRDFHVNLAALESQQSEQTLLAQWEQQVGKVGPPTVTMQWSVVCGTRSFTLKVQMYALSDKLELTFFATHPNQLVLHWGGCATGADQWKRVSTSALIEDENEQKSIVIDEKALQTPFTFVDPQVSIQKCSLAIKSGHVPDLIAFVLKEHASQIWLKNKNADFLLQIPHLPGWKEDREKALREKVEREQRIAAQREKDKALWDKYLKEFIEDRGQRDVPSNVAFASWTLSDDIGVIDCCAWGEGEATPTIVLQLEACLRVPCTVHWGCVGVGGEIQRRKHGEWICPPSNVRPPGTVPIDAKAAQTKLEKQDEPFYFSLQIRFPAHVTAMTSVGDIGLRADFGGVAFVLKETDGPRWFKAIDGRDMLCRLYATDTPTWQGTQKELVATIIEAEVEWDHMTLMHRYNLCTGIIDKHVVSEDVDAEHEFWSWIFVWNRFSFLCWLDWQRRYNTKPKDLAHAAEVLSCKVARCWHQYPRYRVWTRMTLATMGRGGSSGQAIRDRILDIMHKHKLPETAGNFYEQWHQKLHNNTTPDDIGICLAVIRFLETHGDLGAYWHVLREHGISREKLASYERSIRLEPYMPHCDIGSLIWDFRQYLDILKEVHDALDLSKSANRVRHLLRHDLQGRLDRILHDAQHSRVTDLGQVIDRMGQVYDVRCDIISRLNGGEANEAHIRDLLLLDFSLESMSSALLQGANKTHGTAEQWMLLLGWLIELWGLHNPCEEEWKVLAKDWQALGMPSIRSQFTHDRRCDALMAKALLDRLTRAVGDATDAFQQRLGASSGYLGLQVDVEPAKLNVFVDEVLRGSSLFAVSVGVKHLEPLLRAAAELPPWQLISLAPRTRGVLVSVATLSNIQDKVFDIPTILISDAVNGEEEIPTGVQGVLVRSAAAAPDILSHIAVRARNAHVLLAVCFSSDIVQQWERDFQNQWVEISVILGGSDLTITKFEPPVERRRLDRRLSQTFDRQLTQSRLAEMTAVSELSRSNTSVLFDLRKPSDSYFVTMGNFTRDHVGSKSVNLLALKDRLKLMLTPRAFAMPYGSLQKTLCAPENQNTLVLLEKVLSELSPTLHNAATSDIFAEANKLIDRLVVPADLRTALTAGWAEIEAANAAVNSGIVGAPLRALWEESGEERCWTAVKAVWASVFAMRPWVSLAKANRSFMSLQMAILIQELMPADYAFVLHSRNPFGENSGPREMYGEIVQGLGEVLVANYPGRALSWKMVEHQDPVLVAFPAKSHCLLAPRTLIFRSDSNGEDLEGFAGAGLFESVPAIAPKKEIVCYKDIKLVTDHNWRNKLLKEIGNAAFAVEDAFGTPMDIEGVVCGDKFVIVQARPQV